MTRTVTTQFGTFEYEPTSLEGFVEKLASAWGFDLTYLKPTAESVSFGPFLERGGGVGYYGSLSLRYTRNPSEVSRESIHRARTAEKYLQDAAPLLYADNQPRSEFAYIRNGEKNLEMEFRPDGMRRVSVHFAAVAEALRQADSIHYIFGFRNYDSALKLDFYGSGQRTRDEPTPAADTRNAFNFVVAYLHSQERPLRQLSF